MEEFDNLDNLSIKSFSTSNSIDIESIDNNDKELNNETNESIDKELNNEKNDNDNKINLIDNQQSKRKSIDNLLYKDKWILKLDWHFREDSIKLLSEYTKLLITNKEISIDNKELLENNKNDLIKLLNKSPLKLDEESKSYEICLNLNNIFKHHIIDQLIKNENLIIYYKNKIDFNLKNKLIEENNNLITKIINLPVEYLDNDVNLVDDEELKSGQLESKDEKLVNKFETKFSNLQNETINQKDEINKLKTKLDDKILKIENLKNQLDENNSFKLYCVKKDIKNFFDKDDAYVSEAITFLNINWYILIKSNYDKDKKKYLEFYLSLLNKIDDKNCVKWRVDTSYDLILKNNLTDKEDKCRKIDYTFGESIGRGSPKFISEEDLFNLENGYIKDDSIKLEVNLKINKIERNI